MKFRDDIDIASTWVTSDSHFGHDNIVGFCHRPEDHDQVQIAEWRAAVPDDGTLLHLGDLSYRSNARFKALTAKELTGGRKLLIRGNHDKQRFSYYRDCGFKEVKPFGIRLRTSSNGLVAVKDGEIEGFQYIISFSHYPWKAEDDLTLDGERESGRQSVTHWRLHGHIHNNGYQRAAFVPFLRNHINMSVEQTRYTPVNLKLLLDAAILGKLPATAEEEAHLADYARQRRNERMAAR